MSYSVPAYCFIHGNRQIFETELYGKRIYIFGDHAAAFYAWHKIKREVKNNVLNLITFDKHSDTMLPLLRYKNVVLMGNEEGWLAKLEQIKQNLSDKNIEEIINERFTDRDGLKPHLLYHDEHIATAIYMNIIRDAYIVSRRRDRPLGNGNITSESIIDIYQHVHYMARHFECDNEDGFSPKLYLTDGLLNDVYRDIDTNTPYVLDIDLDYFEDISVFDDAPQKMEIFKKIIVDASAITIATEPMYVEENVESDSSGGRVWNSYDCCQKLMNLICACLKQ